MDARTWQETPGGRLTSVKEEGVGRDRAETHTRTSSTYVCHFGHGGAVGPLVEDGRVVVDVLHANDEL